jgi:hypothetical protein
MLSYGIGAGGAGLNLMVDGCTIISATGGAGHDVAYQSIN